MSSSVLTAGLRRLRDTLASQQGSEDSDEHLLHAFLSRRDDSAFAVLVRRHGPMVLHVCRRVLGHQQDAEDAFQATFLILARNAVSLRKKSSLASFLHGTAYRIALKAKQSAARRRKHEGQAPARSPADPADELLWGEVRTQLDEAISHLPDKYRVVFVLFNLEGLGREETARRLGLKPGTVASRLAEARKRLSRRLARRGVELTAVLAAAALATPPATALPAGLMACTLRAARAANEGLAGAVSASVAELVQGATAAIVSKTKIAAAVVLAVSMLAGASMWFRAQPQAGLVPPAESPAAKSDDKPKAVPPKTETATTVVIQGRVLDPEGKPKARAKLLLLTEEGKVKQLGVSGADGCFAVEIPKEPKFRRLFRYLVAQVEGCGIDFFDVAKSDPKNPLEFRLVKDNVIRGRVVNTEGKPVHGVRVTAEQINVRIDNSLDTFLTAYLQILSGGKGSAAAKVLWENGGALFAATTDADGRFAIRGVGGERTVQLCIRGGGIADTMLLHVVNRAGFDPKPYNQAFRDHYVRANRRKDQPWMQGHLLHGPEVSLVAEAEKIIRGVVTDADTGKGQPDLVVALTASYSNFMPLTYPQAKTDSNGRYEIRGVHKDKSYRLESLSNAASGYTPSQVWADDSPGQQSITVNLKVKKGVIVTGKVIDKATGEAIPGSVAVAVLSGNPFVKEYHYDKFETPHGLPLVARGADMAADGSFRLVTLPGPVLLMGGPNYQKLEPLEALKFKPAVPDPQYPKYFQVRPGGADGMSFTYSGLKRSNDTVVGNFCKVLDIKPGVAVVKQDILLECASAVTVAVQDADGRPLSGVWVTGVSPRSYRPLRMDLATCPVYHLEAGKPRLLVFHEPRRKLVAALTVRGDEKPPRIVKLGPAGSLKGRLLDADGKPLAGMAVDLHYRAKQAEEIRFRSREGKQIVTDAAGAFAFDELIPGMKFELSFRRGQRPLEGVAKTMEIQAGECRDVGAIKVKPRPE
jgi:RNA polymerase sigma factor (sigma-70 family)